MNFLEKDLEDIIFSTKNIILNERGLPIEGIKRRQVSIGNYGRADIITRSTFIDREYIPNYMDENEEYKKLFHECLEYKHDITIYELKQNIIDHNSFLQALGYCKGIDNYLSKVRKLYYYRLGIILIGKELSKNNSFCYLPGLLNGSDFSLKIFTYSYNIDGLSFKEETGYSLINEGF